MKTRSSEAWQMGKKEGYHIAAKDILFDTCSWVGNGAKSTVIVAKDFFLSPNMQSTVRSFADTAHTHLHKAAGVCKEGAGHVYRKVTDPEFHKTITETTKNVCETAFTSMKKGYNHVMQCSKDLVERCQKKGFVDGVKESLYMTATWIHKCTGDSYNYVKETAGSQYKTWFAHH